MKKQKSIKNKILFSSLIITASSLLILGICVIFIMYNSSQSILKHTLAETSDIAAERVSQEITAYQNIIYELGCNSEIADKDVSIELKKAIAAEKISKYNLLEIGIIDEDGTNIINGINASDRAYFKASMNGETYITEPLIGKSTGKLSLFISAPIWKDGLAGSTVVGVVVLAPQEDFLCNIVSSIKVSNGSGAYILDASGTTIAHTTKELVENQNNSIALSSSDSKLKSIASLERKMITGESGFGKYSYGGTSKFLSYAPINNTNSWSLGITVPIMDFMDSTIIGIVVTVTIIIVTILIAVIILKNIAANISRPLKNCTNRLELLSKGDLNSPIEIIETNDEIGVLTKATSGIVNDLKKIINDMSYLLKEMAEGNFNITLSQNVYIGDYQPIIVSLNTLLNSLNKTLCNIEESSSHVSSGAEQMAFGAQNLAEGAADQAGAIEELLATTNDISEHAKVNAVEVTNTCKEAMRIGTRAAESSKQVLAMTNAMVRISDASKKIAHIIGSIEDIASQTNLLSLNAAIEAARAGDVGKGFAVVAGEIRNLATQSAEAAEDTRRLIDTTMLEVNSGTDLVDKTASTINEIIDEIEKVSSSIEAQSLSFGYQVESITQINKGLEQISNVVQNNSATAQESSATSEELSAQATTLKQLISQFRLSR